MANLRRGQAVVELGGKEVTLHFGFNEIEELERIFGNVPIGSVYFVDEMSTRAVIMGLVVGLRKFNKPKTPQQIGKILDREIDEDPAALAKIMRGILRALMGARGATEKELARYDEMSGELLSDEIEARAERDEMEREVKADPTSTSGARVDAT